MMKQIKHEKALADLKRINRNISSISGSVDGSTGSHKYIAGILVMGMLLFCFGFLLYLGPEITGFVTFSESVVKTETADFNVFESGNIEVSTDLDDINTLMLSGKIHGNGKAAIFLKSPDNDKKLLAYYFEGDAADGVEFRDMCYDTCHVSDLKKENTLVFELDGMWIDLDSIKYIYGRLIDFELEPLITQVDYKSEPARIIELKLTNKLSADYTVLLYLDGPLSSSFSWQGSLVHMTADEPEKIIPIKVKLPANLPPGEYTHKVTARYVPPDTFDFVGESPVAESFITVYN